MRADAELASGYWHVIIFFINVLRKCEVKIFNVIHFFVFLFNIVVSLQKAVYQALYKQ